MLRLVASPLLPAVLMLCDTLATVLAVRPKGSERCGRHRDGLRDFSVKPPRPKENRMGAHWYTRTRAHWYTRTRAHTHTYAYTYTYTSPYTHTHTYYTHTRARVYIYIYVMVCSAGSVEGLHSCCTARTLMAVLNWTPSINPCPRTFVISPECLRCSSPDRCMHAAGIRPPARTVLCSDRDAADGAALHALCLNAARRPCCAQRQRLLAG